MKIAKILFGLILMAVTVMLLPHLLFSAAFGVAALFTPSPIMNEIRKKAGSDVFSKNHYGPFIRKRVKPINPQTPGQLNVRADMTLLSKGWKNLGIGLPEAWNTYAHGFALKNRLGQTIHLSGEAFYIKLNRILKTIGVAPISTPPSSSAVPPGLVDTPGLTLVSATSVTFTCGTAMGANQAGVIMMSAPLSQGKFYNSGYKFIYAMLTADSVSKDISAAYIAAYGRVPVTGEKVFLKIFSTDSTNGLRNTAQAISQIC